jgi:hypothetical protein
MASISGVSDGANNPFDDLVDSIKTLNSDQNDMAKEAAVYSKELQDHLERDAMNMSQSQIDAMQQLIMTLKEGRLDDLEADKEQLLRGRMEKKRDEERNDSLFDIFKQLKLQFRLLQMQFKDEKGSRIFGFLVRTAIFSFLIGAFKGFMTPYANIGKGIIKGATNMGKTLGLPVLFDNIKNVFKGFGDRVAKTFKFSPEGKGGGVFAKGARFILNAGKDLGKLMQLSLANVGNFLKGMTGFLTGRKSAFTAFGRIDTKIKASGLVGQGANKLVKMILKPFRMLMNLPKRIGIVFARGLDAATASAKNVGKNFTNIGTKIFMFFNKLPVLKTVFGVLDKFKGAFQRLGMVFGQILRPVLGIIGFVRGFIDGMKSQEDNLNKFIAGVFDGLKGAFRMLVGSLLDFFVITIPAFFLGLFGFDGIAEKMKSFSFADLFDSMFDAVKNAVLGFFNRLRDGIADIGFGGIIKNIGLSLLSIFMKIAAFPKAIAAAALSAIGAAMPGGESPKEAFSRKFNEVMSRGQATIDAMMAKRDGKDEDGQIIDALSKEGKVLQSQALQEKYPAGPPTQNISYQNAQGGATFIVNGPPPSDFNFKNAALINQYSD